MKTFIAALLVITLPFLGKAQSPKPSWPEMKRFHQYMSTTFHPAEEGNLAPLKAKADSLYIHALLWEQSTIPPGFKPEETKKALTKLSAQCASIQQAVTAGKDDATLTKLITEAHDIFHHIVGECRKVED
ncbi:MAG TPA: hypothetical protein PKC39_15140 [Ferruginibacter sp.]|nr:hypothetical protein [Ferruginibacter sp.]HMP22294.1 hypothetical protein [Ferruginibacter sp.]